MQTARDPIKTRHGRLFELIRQKMQADGAMARLNERAHGRLSANEEVQIQRAAARSLQPPHEVRQPL